MLPQELIDKITLETKDIYIANAVASDFIIKKMWKEVVENVLNEYVNSFKAEKFFYTGITEPQREKITLELENIKITLRKEVFELADVFLESLRNGTLDKFDCVGAEIIRAYEDVQIEYQNVSLQNAFEFIVFQYDLSNEKDIESARNIYNCEFLSMMMCFSKQQQVFFFRFGNTFYKNAVSVDDPETISMLYHINKYEWALDCAFLKVVEFLEL